MMNLKKLLALVILAAGHFASAESLVNCEFVSGPISELKETQSGKDVYVGIAECERTDGVDLVTLVYGAPGKCVDATTCANDESIPKLKMETHKVDAPNYPIEDKKGTHSR